MSTTNLILKQLPRFPAHVSATNGLVAVVENGVDLVIVPDFGALVPVPAVTNPSLTYFMAWDSSIDYYQSISFTDLANNLAEQVLAGTLLALKNVTFAANQGVYFSDANTAHAYSLSSFVRGISGSADAATFRTGIGIGTGSNGQFLSVAAGVPAWVSPSAAEFQWLAKAVGEFYFADDGVTGVEIPPSGLSGSTVWVELTAGLTGVGQFNNGKLTAESVTGSAPLVLATAQVNLTGSPMNGQTIRLLNTERRNLRAGSAGTLQNDSVQDITGSISGTQESFTGTGVFVAGAAGPANRPNNGTASTLAVNFALSNDSNARTSTETRGKNIGVRVFRRIK